MVELTARGRVSRGGNRSVGGQLGCLVKREAKIDKQTKQHTACDKQQNRRGTIRSAEQHTIHNKNKKQHITHITNSKIARILHASAQQCALCSTNRKQHTTLTRQKNRQDAARTGTTTHNMRGGWVVVVVVVVAEQTLQRRRVFLANSNSCQEGFVLIRILTTVALIGSLCSGIHSAALLFLACRIRCCFSGCFLFEIV